MARMTMRWGGRDHRERHPRTDERADRRSARRVWWTILLAGLALYLLAIEVLAGPTPPGPVLPVLVVGAFLPPVSFAAFLCQRGALTGAPLSVLALTFLSGGVGSIAAQLLEPRLLAAPGLLATLAVGFGEEAAKLIAVAWLLGKREYASTRHGFVFGAAAGAGFAAFESVGYALTLYQLRGDAVLMGQALLARALLAPLVHGTWAAIVAGVLWRERQDGRVRISGPVLGAFFGVVGLHGLWEWTDSALRVGISLPGRVVELPFMDVAVPALWVPIPAIAIGLAGLWILARLLRQANREQQTPGVGRP